MFDNLEVTKETNQCSILVKGEVSFKDAINLKECIFGLADDGHKKIVVNLRNITFLDSSGIGILLNSQRYLAAKKGILELKNIKGEIMEVLKIAGLDKDLNIINAEN